MRMYCSAFVCFRDHVGEEALTCACMLSVFLHRRPPPRSHPRFILSLLCRIPFMNAPGACAGRCVDALLQACIDSHSFSSTASRAHHHHHHTLSITMSVEEAQNAAAMADEEIPTLEAAEVPQNAKQSKRYAKAMAKMGLKPEPNITKVTIRKVGSLSFAMVQPEVYRFPGTNTFVIFGEAQLED
ncbi:nascent polypeptide associated complex subunit-like protein, copy 2, partial [Leishmania donovani]